MQSSAAAAANLEQQQPQDANAQIQTLGRSEKSSNSAGNLSAKRSVDAATETSNSDTGDYVRLKTPEQREQFVLFALNKLKSNGDITQKELDEFIAIAKQCGYKLELVDEGEGAWGWGLSKGAKTLTERVRHTKTGIKRIEENVASAAGLKEATKLSLGQKVELRQYVISKTGRENGPDIALKVLPSIKGNATYDELKKIINENSSITEVMNLLAFLTNNKIDRSKSIIEDLSIASGTHNDTGVYTDPEKIGTEFETVDKNLSVFASLKDSDALFNIATFKQLESAPVSSVSTGASGGEASVDEIVYIPQGILKRDSTTYEVEAFKLNKSQIPLLISACILQMVNILENTRQVFGGWTKLFKEMQGGSSKPKNKSKKTRRRNRRIN
jgi:hypothetical protein